MATEDRVRLIIADDDDLVGENTKRVAEELGHQVLAVVTNGRQAVETTLELKPQAVIMDVRMPLLNGLEAASEIDQQHPTPVVILSAHDSPDFLEEAGRVGVGAYLQKPVQPAQLSRSIVIAMARHADLMRIKKLLEESQRRQEELETAMKEIKALRGLLPICAQCKSIRNDSGYWEGIESYLKDHADVKFTHCYCPVCAEKARLEMASSTGDQEQQ